MSEPDRGVLAPPAPVVVVQPEEAVGAVPLADGKQSELQGKAVAFVADLVSTHIGSPDFTQKVSAITSMGDQDMRRAASVSRRMLDRPAAAMVGTGGRDAQSRVARTLADLRTTITDLDPRSAELNGARKLLRWLPGGSRIDDYFLRYQSAQSHLDAIITALSSGQDELRKDNAEIETEKAALWATMATMAEYTALAAALDAELEARIAPLEASGRVRDATTLRTDALFPVRQRRQDFATQAAVNVQGYMALELVRRNNLELIKGVDRAQTTTVAALRTAVIVSQSVAQQGIVLDQVAALTTATAAYVGSASTPDVATLQAAFDDVATALDALDAFTAQAGASMAQTVTALEGQLTRSVPGAGGPR